MGAVTAAPAGNTFRTLLMAAVRIGDVFTLLQGVEEPDKNLKAITKKLEELLDAQAETGEEIPTKELEKIFKQLSAIKEPPPGVAKAVLLLEREFGPNEKKGSNGEEEMPPLGNLPIFTKLEKKPRGEKMDLVASVRPGVYRARLIRAGKALDGRIWTAKALKAAVENGKFEGRPVKVMVFQGKYGDIENHLPDGVASASLFGNQVGFVRGATWDDKEQSVYGSVWITDPSRRSLIDTMLEQELELPGMSIYATGKVSASNEVVSIEDVDSMDLVTFPAADGRILQALTASVKNALQMLAAAEEIPEVPSAEPAPPRAPEPVEDPGAPKEPEGGKYGPEWLKNKAAQLGVEMLGGKEAAPDFEAKVSAAAEEVSAAEYDASAYPIDQVIELMRKVFQIASGSEANEETEDQQEAAKPEAPTGGAAQPSATSVANQGAIGGALRMKDLYEMKQRRERLSASSRIEQRLNEIERRVATVDTEQMVAGKLMDSGLPDVVVLEAAKALKGQAVSPSEVDQFVDYNKRVVAGANRQLAGRAAVNIEGRPIGSSEGPGSVKEALADLLGVDLDGPEE